MNFLPITDLDFCNNRTLSRAPYHLFERRHLTLLVPNYYIVSNHTAAAAVAAAAVSASLFFQCVPFFNR